jgi:hypothetical protein
VTVISSGIPLIPNLDSNYRVIGVSPNGASVFASSKRMGQKAAKVFEVNTATGKMNLWKTFGAEATVGVSVVNRLHLSSDRTAYAYVYSRILSEAYVVTGLK